MATKFEQLFTEKTGKEAHGIGGASVFAVDSTGHTLLENSGGTLSAFSDDKVSQTTPFWIYSITKTVTAISALQCVDDGLIGLDDAVTGILPELAPLPLMTMGPQGPSFGKRSKEITLRHLLTHTSGIGMDVFDPRLRGWRLEQGQLPQAFCGKSIQAYSTPLLFEPGEGWAYGGSLEWAGVLVERLRKLKLGEAMQQHVFGPLQMQHTTFHPEQNPEISKGLASIAMRGSDGTLIPTPGPHPEKTEDDSGAMGLVSTPEDMKKLTIDLLKPKPTILSQASVQELFRSQLEEGSGPSRDLAFGAMMFGRSTGEPYDELKVGHSFGAYFTKKDSKVVPGGTLLMTGIPNLLWIVNREVGRGGLYASAVMPPDDALSGKVMVAFLHAVFA